MQLALSTWVKFMLPRTGSSLLCRAIANRFAWTGKDGISDEGGLLPHHVFSADVRCRGVPCAAAAVSGCGRNLSSHFSMKSRAGGLMAEPECANTGLVLGKA